MCEKLTSVCVGGSGKPEGTRPEQVGGALLQPVGASGTSRLSGSYSSFSLSPEKPELEMVM